MSTDKDLFEWVLSVYSDSTKSVKIAGQEIFAGRYDSVKTISAGKNAPIFFVAKSYDGKLSVYSRDGVIVLPSDMGIRQLEPLRYSFAPKDYEMYKITGDSGKVGVLSPEMQMVFPMEYDKVYLDVEDNRYDYNDSPADSLFFLCLSAGNLRGIGSVDGRYLVPMQEIDSYQVYRHWYYYNPYCKEVDELSWAKVVNGGYGDRCAIIGFEVKKKGMISL